MEFQACGLPRITTDVRALPEINNDKYGWLIQVAKNGAVDLSSDESLHDLSARIEIGKVFRRLCWWFRKMLFAIV